MTIPNTDDLTQKDALTQLYSRKTFLELFTAALVAARTNLYPLSIALLDIDMFKRLNESAGHTNGDAVIRVIADLVRTHAGEGTLAGRFGGEEYAILFPNLAREQAFLTVERIRQAVEQQNVFTVDGINTDFEAQVTLSGGIASYPMDGTTESELLRKVDQALYQAKIAGRNRIRLAYEERMTPKTSHYPPTQLERLSHLAKEQGVGEAELLREALDDLLIKYKVSHIES